jgi:hypothetical protein
MPKVTEIFAFIAEDTGPDDEGVAAALMGNNWVPLLGADMARIDSLRPLSEQIAQSTGKQVRLLKFSHREEMEVIEP